MSSFSLLLSSQQLTDEAVVQLLKSQSCGELAHLDLSNNSLKLTELDLSSLCPNLIRLDLSHNPITELPEHLCTLQHLQHLRLEGCALQRLPVELGGLAFLKSLALDGNEATMTWPPRDVVAHGDEWTIEYLRCEYSKHKADQEAQEEQRRQTQWDSSLARVAAAREAVARDEQEVQSTQEAVAPNPP